MLKSSWQIGSSHGRSWPQNQWRQNQRLVFEYRKIHHLLQRARIGKWHRCRLSWKQNNTTLTSPWKITTKKPEQQQILRCERVSGPAWTQPLTPRWYEQLRKWTCLYATLLCQLRLKWCGNVFRMSDERITKEAMTFDKEPPGKDHQDVSEQHGGQQSQET